MSVAVRYSEHSLRQLRRIDAQTSGLITRRVRWMADHLDEVEHYALRGSPPGRFRLRVGDYRVIYQLLEQGVSVITIGHRSDVYH